MATIAFYNQTRFLFLKQAILGGAVNMSTAKVMLRNASTVFNATHTVVADLAGAEVSGNGWTAGGEPIANPVVNLTGTNEGTLDADDISKTATGGNIGPATSAVVIAENFASPPVMQLLWFIDFEGSEEAGEGTDFKVNWDALGIHRHRAPA